METKNKSAVLLAGVISSLSMEAARSEPLRPLSTDRPDTTESPHTVDAGRFQMEIEVGSYTKDGTTDSFGFGEVNAKYGMDASTDVQFVLPIYNHIAGGAGGFGDMQVRVKRNLWGNDEGATALAVMPFIQLPTGADRIGSDEVEGGLIVPYGFEGANGWGFGIQGEIDIVADENGSGHHFSFLGSATAAHALTEDVGAFIEIVAIFSEGSEAACEYYFNSGLTLAVTEMLQFDGGVRVGLSNDAEDFTPFVGVSAKF